MQFLEDLLERFHLRKSKILWSAVLFGLFLSPFIPYIWIVSILAVMLMSDKDLEG